MANPVTKYTKCTVFNDIINVLFRFKVAHAETTIVMKSVKTNLIARKKIAFRDILRSVDILQQMGGAGIPKHVPTDIMMMKM